MRPEADPEIARFPEIPAERIAQRPLEKRDAARLMVVDRRAGSLAHRRFGDLAELIRPGDALVLNDVRVFPARLTGRKPTGGRAKILLLKRLGAEGGRDRWMALLTPSMKPGAKIVLPEGASAEVAAARPSGEYEVLFSAPAARLAEKHGEVPLPPYIRRETAPDAADREFYQTVYSREAGGEASARAVAAPTAGLHFTEEMLDALRRRGVRTAALTLYVGWGTFRPVKSADYREHRMLGEEYVVSDEAAETANRARREGGRVWAVGTTVVRTLESVAGEDGGLRAASGETDLFIYPGHKFRAVDALVTNFHLPGYTPLLLAAAFAGTPLLRRAYEEALKEGYRFFSYGDAMVIV